GGAPRALSRDPPLSSLGAGGPGGVRPFPTRRSSDLEGPVPAGVTAAVPVGAAEAAARAAVAAVSSRASSALSRAARAALRSVVRSEEHTSELQSRENLVCRLLLEKKKNPQCGNHA